LIFDVLGPPTGVIAVLIGLLVILIGVLVYLIIRDRWGAGARAA
jgi:hypothetical protein